MACKSPLTQEQIDFIITSYQNFVPIPQIGKVVNRTNGTIHEILRKNNIPFHGAKLTIPIEDRKIIASLYVEGYSLKQLAKRYNTTANTILKCLKENGIQSREKTKRKYHANSNYFDVIDTQEKSYLIGLYWSDGYNRTNRKVVGITLQEGDKQLLEDVKKLLDADYPLYFSDNSKIPNRKNTYTLEITDKHMSETLEKLGMVRQKSLILKFPEWMDESLYKGFITGMIDGDGSIDLYKYRIQLVATEDICEHIHNYLAKLGIYSYIYDNLHNGVTKSLLIPRKENSIKFLNWLYDDDGSTIHLQRKYEVYLKKYCSKDTNNSLSA